MVTVQEAKNILAATIWQLSPINIPLSSSLHYVIAEDIFAPIDVPSFDNAAMDGYAIALDETLSSYQIIQFIQAGDGKEYNIAPGQAARIYTGAPVPKGADTVIQQELVAVSNSQITFESGSIAKGANIRKQAAQCKTGDIVVKQCSIITPGMIALLSSLGIQEVIVFRKPKVKIIITGNELVLPGNPLRYGEIYNSNQATIYSYLQQLGITEIDMVQVQDNADMLREQVSRSWKLYDVLILSGGISVGDYDFVYPVLQEEKVTELFYKVKQKPGKPLFAGRKEQTLVFALPGNPASVLSCFNQYVKPSLQMLEGYKEAFNQFSLLPLAHEYEKKGMLSLILKAEIREGYVHILQAQESFNLLSFAKANAFVVIHDTNTKIPKGSHVHVYNW